MRLGPPRPSTVTDGRAGTNAWPPRLLAPVLGALLVVMVLLPALSLLWAAMTRGNWVRIDLVPALANSVLAAALATLLAMVVAVPLAWLVATTDLPFASGLRSAVMATLLVPSFAFAIGWHWLAPSWPPIMMLTLVLATAAMAPIFLAATWALAQTSASEAEAARLLGVSAPARTRLLVQRFGPACAAAAVLTFSRALVDLGAPLLLTAPAGLPLLTTEVLRVFETTPQSATLAFAVILLCVLSALLLRLAGQLGRHSPGLGKDDDGAGARPLIHLGPWRWPCLVGVVALITLLAVLPITALVVRAFANQQPGVLIAPVLATLTVATLSAALAVLIGGSVAFLAHRPTMATAAILTGLAHAAAILPGIVLAVAMATVYGRALGGTLVLLVLAAAALALPGVSHHIRAGLSRIAPDEDHAARMLGASPRATFRAIILPQLTPQLIGAWALVFAAACRELPTALMLASPQLRPLAAESVTRARAGDFEQASALAFVAIAISAAVVGLASRASGEPLLMPRR